MCSTFFRNPSLAGFVLALGVTTAVYTSSDPLLSLFSAESSKARSWNDIGSRLVQMLRRTIDGSKAGETSDSNGEVEQPTPTTSPSAKRNTSPPATPTRLNKDAPVFVPKSISKQQEVPPDSAHRAQTPVKNPRTPTRSPASVGPNKENHVTSNIGPFPPRIKTDEFLRKAKETGCPVKNPFRGKRGKGIGDFDINVDFVLGTSAVTICHPSSLPSLDIWDSDPAPSSSPSRPHPHL